MNRKASAEVDPSEGIFETVRVSDGTPFIPERHARRLAESAAALFAAEVDESALLRAIHEEAETLAEAGDSNGFLRVTAVPVAHEGRSTIDLVVGFRPGSPQTAPVDVIVLSGPFVLPRALVGHKTTAYAPNRLAYAEAQRRFADESLLVDGHSNLVEAASANVVVEVDGHLVTPALQTGCLPGITRALLLEQGTIVEGVVPVTALASTAEAFLISTGRAVQPIRSIDGRALRPTPGPLTQQASEAWASLLRR